MRKSVNSGLVTEWQRLMGEWEANLAIYEQATRISGGPSSDRGDHNPAAKKARDRLDEIKQQIDAIVAAGGARRGDQVMQRDHLVLGTIELSTEISVRSSRTLLPSSEKRRRRGPNDHR